MIIRWKGSVSGTEGWVIRLVPLQMTSTVEGEGKMHNIMLLEKEPRLDNVSIQQICRYNCHADS